MNWKNLKTGRKTKALILIVIGVLAIMFSEITTEFFVKVKGDLAAEVLKKDLVVLTNQNRVDLGLKQLNANPILDQIAQEKAQDMAKFGYFAHTSPKGKSPWYWFKKIGYQYLYAGENLAVRFESSGQVNSAWMKSAAHRSNILSKRFTEIGVATADGIYKGKKAVFVVAVFATPMPSLAAIEQIIWAE